MVLVSTGWKFIVLMDGAGSPLSYDGVEPAVFDNKPDARAALEAAREASEDDFPKALIISQEAHS